MSFDKRMFTVNGDVSGNGASRILLSLLLKFLEENMLPGSVA